MEVASSLAKKGCDVAVIAMETVPFERVLGKKVVGGGLGREDHESFMKLGLSWRHGGTMNKNRCSTNNNIYNMYIYIYTQYNIHTIYNMIIITIIMMTTMIIVIIIIIYIYVSWLIGILAAGLSF